MAEHSTVATAALRGAGSGALVGADRLGALFVHALQRGRRDFHSISGLRPTSYDVVVDVEVADRALQILTSDNQRGETWQQR